MNEHFWQGIFIDYKPATFNYHIYNPVKEKVQVVHSINVNKNNLFDHSQVNSKEFADEEWQKWNNDEFENALSDINDPLSNKTKEEDSLKFPHSIINLPTPSLMSLQINLNSNRLNEDTAPVRALDFENVNTQSKDARPDTESAQSPSDFIKEEVDNSLADPLTLSSIISTHQSIYTQSLVKYNIFDHFSNIQYDLMKKVSKANVITAKSLISKSHQHIMKILIMLENNINNINDDEPLLLKKAITSPHWFKWLETMLSELNFHKENGTWNLVNASSDHKVLTEWWIFKLKKNCLGNILKYKA